MNVDFPDYGAENLPARLAVFEVDVKEVREAGGLRSTTNSPSRWARKIWKLRDCAIRSEGIHPDFPSRAVKRQLLDKLSDNHDFEVPPGMVEREFDEYLASSSKRPRNKIAWTRTTRVNPTRSWRNAIAGSRRGASGSVCCCPKSAG